jgi:hypothetical protein
MTRSYATNAITDPDLAADIRAAISGKPRLKAAKAPKKRKGPKLLLSEFSASKGDVLIAQRAIAFDPAMWHHTDLPQWRRNQLIAAERDGTIGFLLQHFASWANDPEARARVRHIDFVRIGGRGLAKHDNLRTAFKYVVDGTCGVVLWGFEVLKRQRHEIGQADDKLEERGVGWSYLQEKSRAQPRGFAIQIRLHCKPSSER